MANRKVTRKDNFEMVVAIVEDSDVENKMELVEFLKHQIELLDRKGSNSKPTKTQKENKAIKDKIILALKDIGKAVTISELNKYSGLENYSNQKLSALANQLVVEDLIAKATIKKVSYFKANEKQANGGHKPPTPKGLYKQKER